MNRAIALCLLLLVSPPFWDTKAPEQWTEEELLQMLNDSPWAQPTVGANSEKGNIAILATAAPIRAAEKEWRRRHPPKQENDEAKWLLEDYEGFLSENEGKVIVLAVRASAADFTDPKEIKALEDECVLKLKGKKLKIAGHFPPTSLDPYLRLIFPREVGPKDKDLGFTLYIPGAPLRFRDVFFKLKDLEYKGEVTY